MSTLDELPTIIDEPGLYQLRNGGTALIHEIRPDTSSFEAKGALGHMYRGKIRYRGLDIWHVSGRYSWVSEMGRDIVGKAIQ